MVTNKTRKPLVSVIVPTRNSAAFLEECLRSIKGQTHKNIELIAVDNNSTDATKKIARKYTKKVFNYGPERSAQRNYGVSKAQGKYVLIIDSDMKLSPDVIASCAETASKDKVKAVIIPEESFGVGFWAECKKLERSFYVGVEWMEAARFFDKTLYLTLKGYNETMVSGEDWDFSQRAAQATPIGRVPSLIFHNEGKLRLTETLLKKYYYAKRFATYKDGRSNNAHIKKQTGAVARYKLFFSRPGKLFKNPAVGIGMLVMKTCEFIVGGFGYILASKRRI